MKLAEALATRADIQKRLKQMSARIVTSAVHQEGESPPEDPMVLVSECERLSIELADLAARVNRTNLAAILPDGSSLTDALAERDRLRLIRAIYAEAAQAASGAQARFMRSELKMIRAVDVPELQRRSDDAARRHRELDTQIQEINWTMELVD